MTNLAHFSRLADRLGQAVDGSSEADHALHVVFGREGPVLAYTTSKTTARLLLPLGFEWVRSTEASGRFYAACARVEVGANRMPTPHHGAWGTTEALAMCSAIMRARAWLTKNN